MAEGGAERARRTPAGRKRGARVKGRRRGGGTGGSSYTGGSTEGWRKGTRISYKALLSDWVAEVAIVLCFDSAWWTCLTFNRCVFADNDDDDDDAKAKATRQRRQQHRDFIVLPRPYFIVADCSFVSAPLNPAGRFFASILRSSSSPVLFLHRSPHPPNPLLADLIKIKRHGSAAKFTIRQFRSN